MHILWKFSAIYCATTKASALQCFHHTHTYTHTHTQTHTHTHTQHTSIHTHHTHTHTQHTSTHTTHKHTHTHHTHMHICIWNIPSRCMWHHYLLILIYTAQTNKYYLIVLQLLILAVKWKPLFSDIVAKLINHLLHQTSIALVSMWTLLQSYKHLVIT